MSKIRVYTTFQEKTIYRIVSCFKEMTREIRALILVNFFFVLTHRRYEMVSPMRIVKLAEALH